MSWKPTLYLLLVAGVLFAFIYGIERHQSATNPNPEPGRLLSFTPGHVTNIQVRATNELSTLCACIMAPPIPALPWPRAAFTLCFWRLNKPNRIRTDAV
jgi:hypothetical protein